MAAPVGVQPLGCRCQHGGESDPPLVGCAMLSEQRRDSDQPHFRYVAAAAVVSKAWFAEPAQGQFSPLRGFRRNVELDRFWRSWFRHERVNFDVAVGDQANLSARNVTCINDPELVTRAAVEPLVTQVERLVIERRSVVPPRNAPVLVS